MVFPYFDPSAGKYFNLSSPEFSIKVTGTPSQNPNATLPNETNKEEVAALGNDIRYIKTKASAWEKTNTNFFWLATTYGADRRATAAFRGFVFCKKKE